ncbi:unnamed protein product, partial [Mesorhabditis spiculigera]
MPVAALIDGRVLCMHGMPSIEMTKKDLTLGWMLHDAGYTTMNKCIAWNEPSEEVEFYEANFRRDCGHRLGKRAIKEAMERLGVQFIIRGLLPMTNGLQRFSDMPLVTVFSSSDFKGKGNMGAVLIVDPETLGITPVFLPSIKDNIKTQKEFDQKLAEGWKIDNYKVERP